MKQRLLQVGLIFLLCGLSFGCSDLMDSMSNAKCMETVVKKYPTAQVIPLPDHKYEYIVIEKDGGPVHFVMVPGKADNIKVDLVIGR